MPSKKPSRVIPGLKLGVFLICCHPWLAPAWQRHHSWPTSIRSRPRAVHLQLSFVRPDGTPSAAVRRARVLRAHKCPEVREIEAPALLSRMHETRQPFFRGALHLGISMHLLVAVAVATVGALATGRLQLAGVFAGKLMSYGASAVYHNFPFQDVASRLWWLRADLTAVSIAIWAPSSAFFSDASDWALVFILACIVTFANDKLVAMQLAGQEVKGARPALLLGFFAWTIFIIGCRYGFDGLWLVGSALYVISFAMSPVLHHRFTPSPWHLPGSNGWHEDFHFVLAMADTCFLTMALQYVTDPLGGP
eukprot:TRINITY_DN106560_c0_g1_i1.p1 TRINITY_DN106560_c0_g1~~TRINITY_DN106560_c0_g1_i1.p1  ORF type:complete len:307 (+),score=42.22 TRINITY_DN106560_c0_g1_i1:84-1004(+)